MADLCCFLVLKVSKYGSGASSLDSLPKIAQMNRELIEKWLSASAESETRQTAKRLPSYFLAIAPREGKCKAVKSVFNLFEL